jgi:hypothetical protein
MLSRLAQLFQRPAERDPYMDALKEIHSGVRHEKPSKAELMARAGGEPSGDTQSVPEAESAAAASHSKAVSASRLLNVTSIRRKIAG